jgi:hypothetical protein
VLEPRSQLTIRLLRNRPRPPRLRLSKSLGIVSRLNGLTCTQAKPCGRYFCSCPDPVYTSRASTSQRQLDRRPPSHSCVPSPISLRLYSRCPDVLHRLRPSYHRPAKPKPGTHVEPDAKKHAADARHLAKYVFARQFGLPHVFQPVENAGMWKYPDFTDRERDITVRVQLCSTRRGWADRRRRRARARRRSA